MSAVTFRPFQVQPRWRVAAAWIVITFPARRCASMMPAMPTLARLVDITS